MNIILILITTILVYVGVNLVLSKSLIRVVLGTSILSHAVHLFLILMSFPGMEIPILYSKNKYVDALPQALVLTAIVISFATTSLLLVLLYRTYQRTKLSGTEGLGGLDE